MTLRPSRVLKRLRSGQVPSCVKLNLDDPRIVEIVALCGFDAVWIDMEHVPNSIERIEQQVRTARGCGIDSIVRVRRGSYSDLILPLEMDATGIMVPHCMSADDARQIARQTRFHPIGRRPVDGGNADGAYCSVPVLEYMQHANRERFVIVQIEDPEPLDQIDAIAAVEGIDMLLFGPGDFSHGIGCPGQTDHPQVLEARRRVAQAAKKHNRFAGTTGTIASLPSLIEQGFQFVNVGADVLGLRDYFSEIVAAFAAIPAGR